MQVPPALGLDTQRTQPVDGLAVNVRFGGVLHAQHHRLSRHALAGALTMRFKDVHPVERLLGQKAVRRLGFGPPVAGARDARRGPLGQALHQLHRPSVAARVAQIDPAKFFFCPAHTDPIEQQCQNRILPEHGKLCVMG